MESVTRYPIPDLTLPHYGTDFIDTAGTKTEPVHLLAALDNSFEGFVPSDLA